MNTLHPDISNTCTQADKLLWDAYARSDVSQPGISGDCRLVIPRYRKKDDDEKVKLRVSEQEARFAFVEALCQGPFRYSVETPTSKLYQFTGDTSVSAQTDLSLYDATGKTSICNVEFKAKGVSPGAKDNSSIHKDVEKLLREPVWGLWFHLLEGVNSSTISKFLSVMMKQIGKVQDEFKYDVEAPGLTLHICVLRQRFSLQKDVPLDLTETELTNYLHVDLQVSQAELTEVKDLNGWKLEPHSKQ